MKFLAVVPRMEWLTPVRTRRGSSATCSYRLFPPELRRCTKPQPYRTYVADWRRHCELKLNEAYEIDFALGKQDKVH